MKAQAYKTKYHSHILIFEYDAGIVATMKEIQAKVGWKDFCYSDDKKVRGWVFSKVMVAREIKGWFPLCEQIGEILADLESLEGKEAQADKDHSEKVESLTSQNLSPIEVPTLLPLYPFQREAVDFVAKVGGKALLSLDMGCGKTIVAIGYAVLKKFPRVLIICPASMKEAWKREILRFAGIKANILSNKDNGGWEIINYDQLRSYQDYLLEDSYDLIVADESHYCKNIKTLRSKITMKIVKKAKHVLFMTGTPVLNRPIELYNVVNAITPIKYWDFAMKFCLHKDAPILMGDLTEKKISEIKIGDEVIGWDRNPQQIGYSRRISSSRRLCNATVKDVIIKKQKLQEVELSDGSKLVCTDDHRWLNGRSENNIEAEFSIAREGRKGGRGRGCASSIVKVLKLEEYNFHKKSDYKLGYLFGAMQGDGFCTRDIIERYNAFKKSTKRIVDCHKVGFGCMDKELTDRVCNYLDFFGLKYTRSIGQNMYRVNMSNKQGFDFFNKKNKKTKTFLAGYLGGIYDAEGSIMSIAQYREKNEHTYNKICEALDSFGFKHTKGEEVICLLGGRKEFLRFWSITCPTLKRKLIKYISNCGGKFMTEKLYVKKIKKMRGLHTVYTITTTTGNYVAYGMGSKNCNPKKNAWGWDFSGASNLDELRRMMYYMLRRSKEEVLSELPEKTVTILETKLTPEGRKEYEQVLSDYRSWLLSNDKDMKALYAEAITKVNYLKQVIVKHKNIDDILENFLESGKKIIVFSQYREAIKNLHKKYEKTSVYLSGETPTDERQRIVDKFQQTPEVKIFFSTIKAGGVGITLTAADTVIFTDISWTPAEHLQAEDRAHRIGQKSSVNVYYLITPETIEEDIWKLLQRKEKVVNQILEGKEGVRQVHIKNFLKKI